MTSVPKYTPGPWDVEDPMGAEIGLSIVQSDLKTYEWGFIAMVCQSDANVELIGRQRFISAEEQEANARLIAAAPDLLEALKLLDLRGHTQATWALAKRAIAKAEGQDSAPTSNGGDQP